jgi:spore germination protein KC
LKKTSRLLLLLIIIIPLAFLFGCSDTREIDDQVYTLVIGVDKGTDNRVRITVQYPTYKEGENKSDKLSQVGNTIISTVEAPSILEAVNILGLSVTRRVSLVHTKMIIFSEDFAREGIGSFLQPISRYRETRRAMEILVCKGTAEDFIRNNETLVGQGLSKAIELKVSQSENTGFFPKSSFLTFYKRVISPYGQPYATYAGINDYSNLKSINKEEKSPLKTEVGVLPGEVPRKGDLKIDFAGTAVFNGDKMIGTLDTYETRYFLMIIGEFDRGIMTIEDEIAPGQAIVLDIRPGRKPKVKAYFNGDTPVININLNIEADIISVQSRLPYEEMNKIDDLNNQLKEYLQRGTKKVIEKSQTELKSDFFGFGYEVAKNFISIEEFEKYHWLGHYPEAVINVTVTTNIRRTGLMLRSSPIIYNEPTED